MANNHEAGGSGAGGYGGGAGGERSRTFNLDEADIVYRTRIPIPPEYRLPHGWHMSNGGYVMPPPPERPEMRALITDRRAQLPPSQRNLPTWAPTSPEWRLAFQREREAEIARFAAPGTGRFNSIGRRAWWYGHGVDATLASYGYRRRDTEDPPRRPVYFPQAQTYVPPPPQHFSAQAFSESSRSGSSGSGGRQRSAPYPPPRRSGGIVIGGAQ